MWMKGQLLPMGTPGTELRHSRLEHAGPGINAGRDDYSAGAKPFLHC